MFVLSFVVNKTVYIIAETYSAANSRQGLYKRSSLCEQSSLIYLLQYEPDFNNIQQSDIAKYYWPTFELPRCFFVM